jgi:hypothetical protein
MTEAQSEITLKFNELPEVVGKFFEHTKWKTFSINIDFSMMPDRQLGWALKIITEYKPIPVDIDTRIFSKILSENLFLCDSKGEFVEDNDAIKIMIDAVCAEWNTLGLWVVKDRWKLFGIHDAPLPESEMRFNEPRARLIIAELELWDAIFDASRDMKTALPYKNCINAWTRTQIESKRFDFSTICQKIGQRKKADNLAKQKAQLTLNKNPFYPDNLTEVNHYNMINAALFITKSPGRREQDFITETRQKVRSTWHRYLAAMEVYIKSLRKGISLPDGSVTKVKALYVEGARLMLQEENRARNVLPIIQPIAKKSLHQRGKYPRKSITSMHSNGFEHPCINFTISENSYSLDLIPSNTGGNSSGG